MAVKCIPVTYYDRQCTLVITTEYSHFGYFFVANKFVPVCTSLHCTIFFSNTDFGTRHVVSVINLKYFFFFLETLETGLYFADGRTHDLWYQQVNSTLTLQVGNMHLLSILHQYLLMISTRR